MIYLNSVQRKKSIEHGQALVEFALSMMFFLIFLLGLLDLGRVYFIYITLEDTAGEAAVFLSINPECNYPVGYISDPDAGTDATHVDAAPPAPASGPDPCRDPNNGLFRARKAAGSYYDWTDLEVDIDYITGGQGIGNTVRVEVAIPFELWTPIISAIADDDTFILRSSATQTIMLEN